jgi:flagellar basal body-associated protein FliL
VDGSGASIWIILILVVVLFLVLWGALFFFIAFATWFISRAGLPDERPRRRGPTDWDDP